MPRRFWPTLIGGRLAGKRADELGLPRTLEAGARHAVATPATAGYVEPTEPRPGLAASVEVDEYLLRRIPFAAGHRGAVEVLAWTAPNLPDAEVAYLILAAAVRAVTEEPYG